MADDSEDWKPVLGFEGIYEVSDRGRIRSLPRVNAAGHRIQGRMMALQRDKWGKLWLHLSRDGKATTSFVHRVVLEAFVGPCPPGHVACHRNDVGDDNRLSNLRWDTPSANRTDQVRNGKDGNARKTHCLRGHPFNSANTIRRANGRRGCVTCQRMHEANAYAKRLARKGKEIA